MSTQEIGVGKMFLDDGEFVFRLLDGTEAVRFTINFAQGATPMIEEFRRMVEWHGNYMMSRHGLGIIFSPCLSVADET